MSQAPAEGLKQGDEIKITDMDVLGMDEKKIDDYLDWYQRTWIDDRNAKSMPFPILLKYTDCLQWLNKYLSSFHSKNCLDDPLNKRNKSRGSFI